ncbi:MAG TPA: hypothetical protein EYP56_11665 [Planctomycetaceae bacterium]|nr:hypothetical protein [Planctomycetaceae bacterium]
MRIVVSAEGEGPDAPVDPRFGRCSHLTVVDIDTMEFRTVPNSGAMASGGAGIRTSQEVAAMGVDAVVTGSLQLLGGAEMCMPGDNVRLGVELISPIAMDENVRFAIREGGRTVGSGVVTKIIE